MTHTSKLFVLYDGDEMLASFEQIPTVKEMMEQISDHMFCVYGDPVPWNIVQESVDKTLEGLYGKPGLEELCLILKNLPLGCDFRLCFEKFTTIKKGAEAPSIIDARKIKR